VTPNLSANGWLFQKLVVKPRVARSNLLMIPLKDVGVDPLPNYKRDVQKGIARWDAYLYVPDPDALAVEFASAQGRVFRATERH
jgi:hypothetical protein